MSQARTLSLIGSALTVNTSTFNLTFSNNITVTANATLNNASVSGTFTATGGSVTIGNSAITNTTITTGNSITNAVITSTSITVGNSTSNTVIGSGYIASSNTTLSGFTTINSTFENTGIYRFGSASISSGATVNIDVLTNAVVFYTGTALGNFTINVRGNSSTTLDSIMSTNSSVTVTLLTNQSATGAYPSAFSIDGVSQTIRYQYGTAFFADTSTISAFTFTIVKNSAATYYVFGSQTRFTP